MVTPGWMSGLPRLADGADKTFLAGDVGLHDPPVIDDQRIGDDGIAPPCLLVDLGLDPCRRGSPLPPPNFTSSP